LLIYFVEIQEKEFLPFAAGWHGASNVVWTTLWLLPMNMNRTTSPACAVMDSGVKRNWTAGIPPGVAAGWYPPTMTWNDLVSRYSIYPRNSAVLFVSSAFLLVLVPPSGLLSPPVASLLLAEVLEVLNPVPPPIPPIVILSRTTSFSEISSTS
jgi:hypothetical protein